MNLDIQSFPHFNWKNIFVTESNRIDPQPGYSGLYPGCKMYDNHLSALNFVLSDQRSTNITVIVDRKRYINKTSLLCLI